MNAPNKIITVDAEIAPKLILWLTSRGGVQVWRNADLSSPRVGTFVFTPADVPGSPGWRFTNTPHAIVTKPEEFQVVKYAEVGRVKVRRGPPMYSGIHKTDYAKLQTALAEVGPEASWKEDYANMKDGSAWFEAVLLKPQPPEPLIPGIAVALVEVVSVTALPQHKLVLTFSDGVSGTFDCLPLLWGEVFEPLKDEKLFSQVFLAHGAPTWPNGADLDPKVLRASLDPQKTPNEPTVAENSLETGATPCS